MTLKYYDTSATSNLVGEFYSITYSDKIIPFKTTIIPMAVSGIAFVYSGNQYTIKSNHKQQLKELTLFGQFDKSHQIFADSFGFCCGISFKPTALFKLTNLNISKLTNSYFPFENLNIKLSKRFKIIFSKYKNTPEILFKKLSILIASLPLKENKDTLIIDKVIAEIDKKEGLISVVDLLKLIPFGQKTLETKFKKMVGLTPGKYIQIIRFLNLMRKYEKNQIDIKDLIYMYDYYDESHFSKDFKLFTNQTFKNYFNEDYLVSKEALKR